MRVVIRDRVRHTYVGVVRRVRVVVVVTNTVRAGCGGRHERVKSLTLVASSSGE